MSELAKVWGKFDKRKKARQPLLAHLCDVAAVFQLIFSSSLFQEHVRKVIGNEFTEPLLSKMCVMSLWHDFGKISPCFQIKYESAVNSLYARSYNHIHTAWNLLTSSGAQSARLKKLMFFSDQTERLSIGVMILSHHGTGVDLSKIRTEYSGPTLWAPTESLDPWSALEELNLLSRKFYPAAFEKSVPLPKSHSFEHLFSGVLMLADWIASDRRFFPFCGEADWLDTLRPPLKEDEALDWSRRQAAKVLHHLHWNMDDLRPSSFPSFESQFGFAPNGVQKAIDELELRPDGGLYVLEAEMGSGKTEAALRLYTRLLCAGLADGLYFANPLRFAATQLFERMNLFSTRTFGRDEKNGARLPVTLAVPGYLRVGGIEGIRTGRFSVDWRELDDTALGWFAESSKRYLAAPLASGTIDQALLAGIRVPHADMRAAALQRSLLVVDEVHSSDAYMTELICGLLKIFKAVGGHVLLMSATLGSESLNKFWRAWYGKRRAPSQPEPETACKVGYPRIVTD